MVTVPLAPRPMPPRRRRCSCRVCSIRDAGTLQAAMMRIVATSYTTDELRAIVRAGRASMLPPDGKL